MAEYAGYVAAPNQFDWGKFSSDLASNKMAIAEKVRAEREKKKTAFEKSTSDIYADIKEPEKGYNPTDNDFFTKAVYAGRDKVVDIGKKSDYNYTNSAALNRVQTNVKNTIASLGETAKSIKANQEKLIDPKFQESQSDIGRNFSKLFITTSNTSNKRMFFGDDGNGYVQEVDSKGNPVSDAKINVDLLRSTQGWSDNSIDYDKQLNDFVGNQVGEYQKAFMLGSGAIKTTQSVSDNPLFKDAKAKLVASLTANDIESARFLTSVGGYASYIETDLQQKEKLLSQGIPEDKLIPVGLGPDGIPTAKLSVKQRIDATTLADDKIQQRVEVAQSLTKPASSGSRSDSDKKPEAYKLRQSLMDEVIGLVEDTANDPTGTVALEKIKGIFGDLPVDVVALTDAKDKTKITGYDVFKLDKDGKRIILPKAERRAPSGAYRRVAAGGQGLYELFIKEQKRGAEYGNWKLALDEYKERGGDMSRVAPAITRTDVKESNAPKETVYLDVATVLENNRKNNPNLTEAQVKADFMSKNKGKKIIWITKK